MDAAREVVITGVGVVSPIGIGREAFWQSLTAGASGIRQFSLFQPFPDIPFQIGAPLAEFDAKEYVQPRKSLKVMSVEIQAAYAAGSLAMKDAGLAKGVLDPNRFGVVLGSELLYGEVAEVTEAFRHCHVDGVFHYDRWAEFSFKDLFPLWMLKYLPNMAACHIGIAHDARGPTNSIVEGQVSSLLAVAEGASAIERGIADVMLAGGSGSQLAPSAFAFRRHREMKWEGDPRAASCPFDARRMGTVPGEGSGIVVLEAREHAERRGATILAHVAATASRYESPQKPGGLTGRAIRNSLQSVLEKGGLQPADIGHVNAQGESSQEKDRLEAQAIREVLGDVPVTAPKSYFGDLGAGSGAVELIASVLALVNRSVPPTLNYEVRDPACPIDVIHGSPLEGAKPTAVVLNQADTGQASAVLLRGN